MKFLGSRIRLDGLSISAAVDMFVKQVLDQLNILMAALTNRLFVCYKVFEAFFSRKRKIRILFSDQDNWKEPLRLGFSFTQHEIIFSQFKDEQIDQYDLVVPLVAQDLLYLNESSDNISNNPIPIPRKEVISLCDDKLLLNKTLIAYGFESFIPSIKKPLRYPIILKKRIDTLSVNSYLIKNRQNEIEYADLLNNTDYFCQEFIHGAYEYTTHILIKNKKIAHAINIEFYFDNKTPIKGKDQILFSKVCKARYLDLFEAMLVSINFEGLCCINYKIDNNKPFVLEINPRIGSSASLLFFTFMQHIDM